MFSSCLSLISGNSMAFFQQGFVEKYLKLWYSWRCVVSSLIAIDTWWGITRHFWILFSVWMTERNRRATPHLCCQRELLFPIMWLNPSVSKISLRFPSHVAHNHTAFAEYTGTWRQTDANTAHPPLGCLQPGFCGRYLLCDQLWKAFFFTTAMFLRFMCCSVQLGWNCYLYGTLLLYSWPHSECRIPQSSHGSWRAAESQINSGKSLVSCAMHCYESLK